ncbi:MAG: AAA family ATPase, partial [Gemmatimonadota bacterium]
MESTPEGRMDGEADIALLERLSESRSALEREIGRRIVGQKEIVSGLLTALLADGHALLVGVPGLAKT